LQKVDLLVTDWLSPPAFLDELREAGVKVVAVSEEAAE
jgi:ABC-type hemin transport system substrate-binding protein